MKYKDNEAILAAFGIDIIKAEQQEEERKKQIEIEKQAQLKAAEEAEIA